jgi:hypothetical protein
MVTDNETNRDDRSVANDHGYRPHARHRTHREIQGAEFAGRSTKVVVPS